MKRLLDQDVYAGTIRFLMEQGYDVLPDVAHDHHEHGRDTRQVVPCPSSL